MFSIPDPVPCRVVERKNRFTVDVRIGGEATSAHINNTGRLVELLRPGALGFCLPGVWEKTRYRLFSIGAGPSAVLIDTRFQMKAFERALDLGLIPWLSGYRVEKRNPKLSRSTADYLLTGGLNLLVEVKSAAMRIGEFASYPDCPSLRAHRQIEDLVKAHTRGYRAMVVFIAAVPGVKAFKPNPEADEKLVHMLEFARDSGVELKALQLAYIPAKKSVVLLNPELPVIL